MENSYASVNRDLIAKEQLRDLTSPATSFWFAAVGIEWSIIALAMWISNTWPHWSIWVVSFFVIGLRQHALSVLAHEGVHHHVMRSLFWNDLLSNVLTAYPLTFTVEGFRATHLKHHWFLETPDDPSKISIDLHSSDWAFPMSKRQLGGILVRDLTGLNHKSSITLLRYLWQIDGGKGLHLARLLTFHGVSLGVSAATGHLWTYLLLWVAPLFTVGMACYRIRSIAEHSGMGPLQGRYSRSTVDSLLMTRTTISPPLWRFIIAPYNIGYHIEHHLYPSVPVFRLRSLHQRLERNAMYRTCAHVTHGYRRLLQELTGRP